MVTQLVKKPERSLLCLQELPVDRILSQMNPIRIFTLHYAQIRSVL
jgi:hypothetical protein